VCWLQLVLSSRPVFTNSKCCLPSADRGSVAGPPLRTDSGTPRLQSRPRLPRSDWSPGRGVSIHGHRPGDRAFSRHRRRREARSLFPLKLAFVRSHSVLASSRNDIRKVVRVERSSARQRPSHAFDLVPVREHLRSRTRHSLGKTRHTGSSDGRLAMPKYTRPARVFDRRNRSLTLRPNPVADRRSRSPRWCQSAHCR
jgi:hypothetical protein